MMDYDLAALYGGETKALNQAVKRNFERFPSDFVFQLNEIERENLMRSQSVTASRQKANLRYFPYAFTELGISMLSGVLLISGVYEDLRATYSAKNPELAAMLSTIKHYLLII